MAYAESSYSQALNILERRKEKANLEAQDLYEEICIKIPELENIKSQLSQIGLEISKVFLYSNDKESDIKSLQSKSLALQEKRKKLLADNGFEENALDVKYTCSACNDTGFIKNRRCKCHIEILKDIEREKLRQIAPIDKCKFDTFDTKYYPLEEYNGISPQLKAEKIKNSCIKYATNFTAPGANSILFMGGTGLGKTHLSLAIANVVINRGYSVIYGAAQNILNDLQNENFGRGDNNRYYERAVLNCDLLIIDDLGTEFKSSYSVACLHNIINSRINSQLPTIISTNYSFDELEEKYDQRITSRIAGVYSKLVLIGNDIRYIK